MGDSEVEAVVRAAYDAFNARDFEAAIALMQEDVDWPDMLTGTRVIGKEAVRRYWAGQLTQIDPHVTLISVTENVDGEVAVDVRQVIRALDGTVLSDGPVRHVHHFRNGLIVRLDVGEIP